MCRSAPPETVGVDFRLALIDSRALVRNAISYFLQTAGSFVVLPFSDDGEFFDQCPDPIGHFDAVALSIGGAPRAGSSGRRRSLPR
jgi:hypothetical protein